MVRLSEVQAKPICYLWEPRFLLGIYTVLEGDPGRSKSTLALEIAAAVSTGRALPGGSPSAPRDVVIISYEDAAADVLLPRLLAAGGDPRRVHVIQGVRARPDAEPSVAVFPDDVAAVADVVQDRRAALLVVDPISAGLAGSIDAHRDADVRRGLAPLAALAEQQHLAVLAIRHLRKGTGRAIVSGGGSIAFAAAARVVIRVDEDPQDPAAGIVSIVKHNLSAHPHSLKFARVSVELAGDVSAPRIEWRGESTYSADDLAALREEVGGGRNAVDDAGDALRGWLDAGPLDKSDLLRRASQEGISRRSLERAAERVGVVYQRQGHGRDHRCTWRLPATTGPDFDSRQRPCLSGHTSERGVSGASGESESSQELAEPQRPDSRHLRLFPELGVSGASDSGIRQLTADEFARDEREALERGLLVPPISPANNGGTSSGIRRLSPAEHAAEERAAAHLEEQIQTELAARGAAP